MNNARRAKLTITRALIEQARDIVARAACEEREYFDDKLPEIILGDQGPDGPTRPRPRSTKPLTASRKSSPHST